MLSPQDRDEVPGLHHCGSQSHETIEGMTMSDIDMKLIGLYKFEIYYNEAGRRN